MSTLKFSLASWSAQDQYNLLKEMFADYIKGDVWQFATLEVHTPTGIFVNNGGFNGNPSDLWLTKKGTEGKTDKTFWRVSFGSKRKGFEVFALDLKFVGINTPDKVAEFARSVGAISTDLLIKEAPRSTQGLSK